MGHFDTARPENHQMRSGLSPSAFGVFCGSSSVLGLVGTLGTAISRSAAVAPPQLRWRSHFTERGLSDEVNI